MTYTLSSTFSLLDPEIAPNPYPSYEILRAEYPVYRDDKLQAWLISRYEDVNNLLLDSRLITRFQSISPDDEKRQVRYQLWQIYSKMMFFNELKILTCTTKLLAKMNLFY